MNSKNMTLLRNYLKKQKILKECMEYIVQEYFGSWTLLIDINNGVDYSKYFGNKPNILNRYVVLFETWVYCFPTESNEKVTK